MKDKKKTKRRNLKGVRLQPDDVLKDTKLEVTFKEMLSQLKEYDKTT